MAIQFDFCLRIRKKGEGCMDIVKVVVASILTVIVKVLIADEDKD